MKFTCTLHTDSVRDDAATDGVHNTTEYRFLFTATQKSQRRRKAIARCATCMARVCMLLVLERPRERQREIGVRRSMCCVEQRVRNRCAKRDCCWCRERAVSLVATARARAYERQTSSHDSQPLHYQIARNPIHSLGKPECIGSNRARTSVSHSVTRNGNYEFVHMMCDCLYDILCMQCVRRCAQSRVHASRIRKKCLPLPRASSFFFSCRWFLLPFGQLVTPSFFRRTLWVRASAVCCVCCVCCVCRLAIEGDVCVGDRPRHRRPERCGPFSVDASVTASSMNDLYRSQAMWLHECYLGSITQFDAIVWLRTLRPSAVSVDDWMDFNNKIILPLTGMRHRVIDWRQFRLCTRQLHKTHVSFGRLCSIGPALCSLTRILRKRNELCKAFFLLTSINTSNGDIRFMCKRARASTRTSSSTTCVCGRALDTSLRKINTQAIEAGRFSFRKLKDDGKQPCHAKPSQKEKKLFGINVWGILMMDNIVSKYSKSTKRTVHWMRDIIAIGQHSQTCNRSICGRFPLNGDVYARAIKTTSRLRFNSKFVRISTPEWNETSKSPSVWIEFFHSAMGIENKFEM